MMNDVKEVIVLGAGVIGLTTALKTQEKGGYHVTIIAELFPTDHKSIKYTSQWAGAHHVSFAETGELRYGLDRQGFEEMWKLSAPGGEAEGCFLRLHQVEYFGTERPSPSPLEHMPNFRSLPKNELIEGALSGDSFETVTIDVPVYLNYLLSRFLYKGGSIVRGSVQHISQVTEAGAYPFLNGEEGRYCFPRPPDAVVVCVGLGARFLGGVEDQDVYPTRGQTVILNAPWVNFGRTFQVKDLWTYIIPRRSGNVIIGGTLGKDDWYPHPRRETTLEILARGLKLCPELIPPHLRTEKQPVVDDLLPLIIEEGCGLRPSRKGGIRLEVDQVKIPSTDKNIPVVYNYGHAGSGYISSIGSAEFALNLLQEALSKSANANST